jgi:DNA polymerase-3 subunit beta
MFDDYSIAVRLMAGQYPKYQSAIPSDFAGEVTLKRDTFIRTLERADLINFQARFQISNNGLSISNREDGSISQFQEDIEIDKQSGSPEFNTGFNIRFLLDFLKSIDSELVEFKYNAPNKAILLRGCDDDTCQYICMPLTLPPVQPAAPVAADIRQAI